MNFLIVGVITRNEDCSLFFHSTSLFSISLSPPFHAALLFAYIYSIHFFLALSRPGSRKVRFILSKPTLQRENSFTFFPLRRFAQLSLVVVGARQGEARSAELCFCAALAVSSGLSLLYYCSLFFARPAPLFTPPHSLSVLRRKE